VHGSKKYALYDLVEGKAPSRAAGADGAAATLRTGGAHFGEYDTALYGARALAVVKAHARLLASYESGAGGSGAEEAADSSGVARLWRKSSGKKSGGSNTADGDDDDDGAASGDDNATAASSAPPLFLWLALHAAHSDHGSPNATLLSTQNAAAVSRLEVRRGSPRPTCKRDDCS